MSETEKEILELSRKELIEALEKAEGPGIALDAEIYCATHGHCERDGGAVILRCSETGHKKTKFAPPAYTSSIDAALTLVPDGWLLQISDWEDERLRARGPWQAILTRYGERDKMASFKTRCNHAPTPAIALCIAALKAHGDGK